LPKGKDGDASITEKVCGYGPLRIPQRDSPTFLQDIQQHADIKTLDQHIHEAAALVDYHFPSTKAKTKPFQTLSSIAGTISPPAHPAIFALKSLLQQCSIRAKANHTGRRNAAKRTGMLAPMTQPATPPAPTPVPPAPRPGSCDADEPEPPPTRRQVFTVQCIAMATAQGIPIVKLKRLPSDEIYPPTKHHILERHYDKLPPPPPLIDKTCEYFSDYLILDEKRLKWTIEQQESAVIVDDESGDIIAIVIRQLVKRYFDSVER